jgi:hypothetical protein
LRSNFTGRFGYSVGMLVLRPFASRLFFGMGLLSALLAQRSGAEPMVLTDIVGRTIKAELVAVNGENVRIRRDDGREFTLELKGLVDDDQTKIRAWAAEQAKADAPAKSAASPTAAKKDEETSDTATKKAAPKYVPDMKKVTMAMSRVKMETTTIAKFEGYSHKHELWGYGIQVTNRNLHPVEKVRIEYNLFARTFSDSSTPEMVPGTIEFPAVGSNRSESAKTKTAEVCKRKGYYTFNEGGELRGIWVKLYVGDELVQEQLMPESLRESATWLSPSDPSARTAPRRLSTDGYYY